MNVISTFSPPEVTDEDIFWTSRLLGLSENAFYGENGTDPRQVVLKSIKTIDVAACPGSGKTTLLIAKLAILAEKWQYRTRGICVLSHTNAARYEIENRLGNTTAGRRLLSYPHFIGTIHGFINEFLAIPWLRSQGFPIKMIDTDICEKRRWYKLQYNMRYALQKKHVDRSSFCISDPYFNIKKKNGQFPFRENTEIYKSYKNGCQEVATEGYHCYDDMFIWANDLMNKVPDLINIIRDRFSLLFIDEAQDNSEVQSAILHRIFMKGGSSVIRQRLGDGNQAIFDFLGTEEAETDKFPDDAIKDDLPNSHRFGQDIADLADPLGIIPYGLVGQGPKTPHISDAIDKQHTIFVFDDNCAGQILNLYGKMLTEMFSEQELLDGTFTAVGQVHKPPKNDGNPRFPHSVGHYWPEYKPELGHRNPRPRLFVQYILIGQRKAEEIGEAYPAVEKIAEGVLRLVGMVENKFTFLPRRRYNHRLVMRLLSEHTPIRDLYEDLIATYAMNNNVPMKKTWKQRWCNAVRSIAESITEESLVGSEVDEYLAWGDESDGKAVPDTNSYRQDNIFQYPQEDPKVHIRVGSIHSIKGETHTATLVLETFWHAYNLDKLKPWIMKGRKGWKASDRVRQRDRLKVHYVAMTRPTHLLCLAMKRSTFENEQGSLDIDVIKAVRQRGWQIKFVCQDEPLESCHDNT